MEYIIFDSKNIKNYIHYNPFYDDKYMILVFQKKIDLLKNEINKLLNSNNVDVDEVFKKTASLTSDIIQLKQFHYFTSKI